MQDTSSIQENDYDIFRYLNFTRESSDELTNSSTVSDLNAITNCSINSLLENDNEDYMSTQHYPASEAYKTTGLRNFTEAFGRPAFGNRHEAIKAAYSNWNLNDNFSNIYSKTSQNVSIPSPIYKWCDLNFESSLNPKNQHQNTFNYQNSNDHIQYPSFYDTCGFSTPHHSYSTNPYYSNPQLENPSSILPNNPECSSNSEAQQIASILSSLLSPTTTSSTQTSTYSFSPSAIDSSEGSNSSLSSYDITPPSTAQSSQSTPNDKFLSTYHTQRVTPQLKLLDLPCYNIQPLQYAKCISCTHYIRPEDDVNGESGLALYPNSTKFQTMMCPFQVAALRPDSPSSLYFVPVPKVVPFTTVQTFFPNTQRTPKKYVTVREMIEERNKQKKINRFVIAEKCEKLRRKKYVEEKSPPIDRYKQIVSRQSQSDESQSVEKNANSSSPSTSEKKLEVDDQNATTLLCLLPVIEHDKSSSKVCPMIPPIVITDFQIGRVNAKEHKPKHFEMKTLKIGSFQIDAEPHIPGRLRNKLKVVFSKRTFIYEFELETDDSTTKMISIEVSFQSLVAIRCFGRLLQLRVKKQPIMFEGVIKPRHGIVTKTPVYNRKRPVDISDGELSNHPVHRIILKRSQSNWLRESLIRFDPWFHALFATPIGDETAKQNLLPSNFHDWETTCKSLKRTKENKELEEKEKEIEKEIEKETEPEAKRLKIAVPTSVPSN